MKIAAAAIHHYRLPLRASWLSAAGGFSEREGWLLRLETGSGATGYGDCAPLPASPGAGSAGVESCLRGQAQRLIGMQVGDALQAIEAIPGSAPAVRLAIESALLDLVAQAAGLSLAAYLRAEQRAIGLAPAPTAAMVNAALGSVSQVAEATVRSACDEHFPVLKLKVGLATVDTELRQLHHIIALLTPGVQLRLDANCAWRRRDAERFLRGCANLPIEMIEEPLAQPTLQQLRAVQAGTAIAIAVDESASLFASEHFFSTPAVRRLVIKPTRCGGLRAACALATRAASAGLDCIVTSSVESACGVTAAAQLAAAIDNRLAHGLATSAWLAADTGAAPTIVNGRMLLPRTAGLGFAPAEEIVFAKIAAY